MCSVVNSQFTQRENVIAGGRLRVMETEIEGERRESERWRERDGERCRMMKTEINGKRRLARNREREREMER